MHTTNKKLAVTPFPTVENKVEVRSALVHLKQKAELTPLTVVYPNLELADDVPEFDVGDTVYVPGDLCGHQLAKKIYELEPGKPFILIDLGMIIGMKDGAQ
jgi:hypothetical protein